MNDLCNACTMRLVHGMLSLLETAARTAEAARPGEACNCLIAALVVAWILIAYLKDTKFGSSLQQQCREPP